MSDPTENLKNSSEEEEEENQSDDHATETNCERSIIPVANNSIVPYDPTKLLPVSLQRNINSETNETLKQQVEATPSINESSNIGEIRVVLHCLEPNPRVSLSRHFEANRGGEEETFLREFILSEWFVANVIRGVEYLHHLNETDHAANCLPDKYSNQQANTENQTNGVSFKDGLLTNEASCDFDQTDEEAYLEGLTETPPQINSSFNSDHLESTENEPSLNNWFLLNIARSLMDSPGDDFLVVENQEAELAHLDNSSNLDEQTNKEDLANEEPFVESFSENVARYAVNHPMEHVYLDGAYHFGNQLSNNLNLDEQPFSENQDSDIRFSELVSNPGRGEQDTSGEVHLTQFNEVESQLDSASLNEQAGTEHLGIRCTNTTEGLSTNTERGGKDLTNEEINMNEADQFVNQLNNTLNLDEHSITENQGSVIIVDERLVSNPGRGDLSMELRLSGSTEVESQLDNTTSWDQQASTDHESTKWLFANEGLLTNTERCGKDLFEEERHEDRPCQFRNQLNNSLSLDEQPFAEKQGCDIKLNECLSSNSARSYQHKLAEMHLTGPTEVESKLDNATCQDQQEGTSTNEGLLTNTDEGGNDGLHQFRNQLDTNLNLYEQQFPENQFSPPSFNECLVSNQSISEQELPVEVTKPTEIECQKDNITIQDKQTGTEHQCHRWPSTNEWLLTNTERVGKNLTDEEMHEDRPYQFGSQLNNNLNLDDQTFTAGSDVTNNKWSVSNPGGCEQDQSVEAAEVEYQVENATIWDQQTAREYQGNRWPSTIEELLTNTNRGGNDLQDEEVHVNGLYKFRNKPNNNLNLDEQPNTENQGSDMNFNEWWGSNPDIIEKDQSGEVHLTEPTEVETQLDSTSLNGQAVTEHPYNSWPSSNEGLSTNTERGGKDLTKEMNVYGPYQFGNQLNNNLNIDEQSFTENQGSVINVDERLISNSGISKQDQSIEVQLPGPTEVESKVDNNTSSDQQAGTEHQGTKWLFTNDGLLTDTQRDGNDQPDEEVHIDGLYQFGNQLNNILNLDEQPLTENQGTDITFNEMFTNPGPNVIKLFMSIINEFS